MTKMQNAVDYIQIQSSLATKRGPTTVVNLHEKENSHQATTSVLTLVQTADPRKRQKLDTFHKGYYANTFQDYCVTKIYPIKEI